MKISKPFLIFSILLLPFTVVAQKAEKILKKSYQASLAVDSGYFMLEKYFKSGGGEDTLLSNAECYFKRIKDDSIYASAFYQKKFQAQAFKEEIVYTGNEFSKGLLKDSSGFIMTKDKWAKQIESWSSNYKTYEPFLSNDNSIYPDDSDYTTQDVKLEYLGTEKINGFKCHKIKYTKHFPYDSSHMFHTVKYYSYYWVNVKDYILVQYSNNSNFTFQGDTMYQYKKDELKSYKLNTPVTSYITKESIPSYINLIPYTKDYFKKPVPLPLDTIAPSWSLTSLDGNVYNLDSLKGKIVVIDFFYRSCAPCMLAIPKIRAIHDKYGEENVVVLGIDPFDEDTEGFRKFITAREVNYPVLMDARDVANEYRVRAYPRIFVIGKDGTIIYVHEGFTETMQEELEKVIEDNL